MHVEPPNGLIGHYSNGNSVEEGDFVISASSRHAGGVNVGMIDGAIRFVADDVAPEVWWAAGSRNDGRIEGHL